MLQQHRSKAFEIGDVIKPNDYIFIYCGHKYVKLYADQKFIYGGMLHDNQLAIHHILYDISGQRYVCNGYNLLKCGHVDV